MKNKLRLLVCYLLICAIVPINLTFAADPIDRAGDGIHIDDIVYYLSHTGSNSDIRNLLDQIAPITPTDIPTPTPTSTPTPTPTPTPIATSTPTALAAPTNLTATAGDTNISLTWSSVTGATYYNVYQSSDNITYNLISAPATITAATYNVTGLTNGISYYFKTTAVNNDAVSTYSIFVSVTPTSGINVALALNGRWLSSKLSLSLKYV